MASRGRLPTSLEGHAIQAPGMLRHGALSGLSPDAGHRSLERIHHPELLETKIAAQAAEMKQLAGDNQRLASTHVVLREELVTAQREVQRLKEYMRNIQTESNIQIRVLCDRVGRMEAEIRAGEGVKKDLQEARKDAHNLVAARQELTRKIQEGTKELQKARADVESLPDLHTELESLRREHQRLRDTFEYEKGLNIEQVEQLQAMDKNLILMAREIEKLRVEASNAEKRAQAPNPYASGFMNPEFPYPPPMQSSVTYFDSHSHARPHMNINPEFPYPRPMQGGLWPSGEGMIAYGSSRVMAAAGTAFPTTGVAAVPSTGVASVPTEVAAIPSTEVATLPISGGGAIPTSGGAAVSTSADAAVHASGGASASNSGGDAVWGRSI